MCVYVCSISVMSAHVCAWVYTPMHLCLHGNRRRTTVFQSISYSLQTGSFYEPGVRLASGKSRDPPAQPPILWPANLSVLLFLPSIVLGLQP